MSKSSIYAAKVYAVSLRAAAPSIDGTGASVSVDDDALGRTLRPDQSEATRRYSLLEQPRSFAEHPIGRTTGASGDNQVNIFFIFLGVVLPQLRRA